MATDYSGWVEEDICEDCDHIKDWCRCEEDD